MTSRAPANATLPEAVLTAAGVRALDARLEAAGLLRLTMENAGRAVAERVRALRPHARVLILVGRGANGGDALVAARHLHAAGQAVRVLALGLEETGLAGEMLRAWRAMGEVDLLTPQALEAALAQRCDLVLDGLLGTGFRPPLRPELSAITARLNAADLEVFAIDLPSGLQADLPQVPEGALRAARTFTLGGPKPALLFSPARECAGEWEALPLAVPQGWVLEHARARRLTPAHAAALLPQRAADAHKGTAGEVWVIGGSEGMSGAPAMAAHAALRTGSGLLRMIGTGEPRPIDPEVITARLPDWADLEAYRADRRPDALALGMGLGGQAARVAARVLAWARPTVVDADALTPELRGLGHPGVVWTPHPAEAARMLACPTHAVLADPLEAAECIRAAYGGTVVLKGGPTVVAAEDGTWVNPTGNPGMASAGMGDTLAGVIASLAGQGLEAAVAARLGVYLHGLSADLLQPERGYGLQATEVGCGIPRAWRALREWVDWAGQEERKRCKDS
ncbi:NAD(P)H-hydrate epimerase [Deinobacterium chartae]|uniref:Bifunctional NAD(P)H-hydrate repair enzyme n=1 Tax=Deinobacterium chartae TaxID=521158 RepID=A0A841HVB3_9DEIO|nr:NAD(P)H-hydrate dehydratase [Deinobacterium chartae]MBB6097431.1 NAD(P)H-hydrate epimerase [Deinobacterium chartae]